MSENVVFREAWLTDRAAVLAIHDNVFEGSDYLPSFYTSYIQNKSVQCYLAEVDGKVVSFLAHIITDGGRHMISGGGRTNQNYQKMGINQKMSKYAVEKTKMRFPQLQIIYSAGNHEPFADKVDAGLVSGGVKVVMRMKFLVYDTTHETLHSTFSNLNKVYNYNTITSQVEQILLSAPNRGSLFHEGVIKVLAPWLIFEPTDDNIKMAVRGSYAVVTCGQNDRVLAVSFGSLCATPKYSFRYDLDLYIDKSVVLGESERHKLSMSHILRHVQHAADVSGRGDRVGIFLSLPGEVNHEAVNQTVKPHLGDHLKTDFFSSHANFIFKRPFPKESKL